MTVPVVALVASPGRSRLLGPVAAGLARRVTVRSLGRAPVMDAVVASDPAAARRAPEGVPLAVLVDPDVATETAGVDGGLPHGAVCLVGPHTDPVPDGAVVVPLPGLAVDTATWPPLAPFTRQLWRRRLGLRDDLAVDTRTVAPADVPTALALAAFVSASADDVPLALALGAVLRDDSDGLALVGARPGREVARGGATDAHDSARLSRAARRLAEDRLDPVRAADRLLAAWGLGPGLLSDPGRRVMAALDDLGTPDTSAVRSRVGAALAGLAPQPEGH